MIYPSNYFITNIYQCGLKQWPINRSVFTYDHAHLVEDLVKLDQPLYNRYGEKIELPYCQDCDRNIKNEYIILCCKMDAPNCFRKLVGCDWDIHYYEIVDSGSIKYCQLYIEEALPEINSLLNIFLRAIISNKLKILKWIKANYDISDTVRDNVKHAYIKYILYRCNINIKKFIRKHYLHLL